MNVVAEGRTKQRAVSADSSSGSARPKGQADLLAPAASGSSSLTFSMKPKRDLPERVNGTWTRSKILGLPNS
jgi:hypothetical protein